MPSKFVWANMSHFKNIYFHFFEFKKSWHASVINIRVFILWSTILSVWYGKVEWYNNLFKSCTKTVHCILVYNNKVHQEGTVSWKIFFPLSFIRLFSVILSFHNQFILFFFFLFVIDNHNKRVTFIYIWHAYFHSMIFMLKITIHYWTVEGPSSIVNEKYEKYENSNTRSRFPRSKRKTKLFVFRIFSFRIYFWVVEIISLIEFSYFLVFLVNDGRRS